MGYRTHLQWVQEVWATWGNRVQGVWGTGVWAYGAIEYRVWGTGHMGHMDNGYRSVGHTGSCVPLDPTLTPSQ